MTKPRHSTWAQQLFDVYLNRLYRRHFAAFYRLGPFPEIIKDHPLLLLPNHSSWWDGFFILTLNRIFFKRRMYLMMLEDQLQNYPFFRRLGAYGINPNDSVSIRRTLRYTSSILNGDFGKNVVACMFPQGELLPWATNPLEFKRGLDLILRNVREIISILPLGMRIEMLAEQRPEVFFLAGNPEYQMGQKAPGANHWQNTLIDILQNMAQEINQGHRGERIFKGTTSISDQVTKFTRKDPE